MDGTTSLYSIGGMMVYQDPPLNSVNFETGDFSQVATQTNASIVSSPALDGNYSLQLQRSNSVANVEIRQSGTTYYNLPSASYSLEFEYASSSGEGGIVNFNDTSSGYKAALHLSSSDQLMFYDSRGSRLATGSTMLQPNQIYTISAVIGTGTNAPWVISINGKSEMSGTGNLGTTNNGALELGGNDRYTTNYYYDDVQINASMFGNGLRMMAPASRQTATEGAAQSLSMGSFMDAGSGPWTVNVAWGDGTTTTLPAPSAPGSLGSQTHTYAEEGAYTGTIIVTATGNNMSVSAPFTVRVNDSPPQVTPVSISPTAGAPYSGPVANFTDPGGPEPLDGTHYSASINWDDGTAPVVGTISFSGGQFTIMGTYTFAQAGLYTISAAAFHEGFVASVQSQATVASLGQFVSAGMVKPIGFWEGLQGQELIRRFGVTSGRQTLGQWLATTFPNLYGGAGGAANLSAFTNAQVATNYQSLFLSSQTPRLDAEVLATSLEVFTTTLSLGGTLGQNYGFTVNSNGLGAYLSNIGSSGQAFGVANNTVLDVFQILLAANNNAVGGEPWGTNSFLRNEAYAVYYAINGG